VEGTVPLAEHANQPQSVRVFKGAVVVRTRETGRRRGPDSGGDERRRGQSPPQKVRFGLRNCALSYGFCVENTLMPPCLSNETTL
jgi:hypothetical protein